MGETMNPRDIMTDAIHNFHPQYQQYSSDNRRFQATNPQIPGDQQQQQSRPVTQNGKAQQHTNGVLLKPSQKDLETGNRHKFDENQGESCADDSVATSATHAARAVATTAASVASNAATAAKSAIQPKQAKVTNNEKTLLLSSDDEFQ